MGKRRLTYDSMLRYLKNLFSNSQRHALEKEVMKDPFEAEALEGLSELSAEAFENDFQKLQSKLSERTQKRKLLFFEKPYAIAASVLFLLGLGLIFFLLKTPKEPYQIVTNTEKKESDVVVAKPIEDRVEEKEKLFREPEKVDLSTKMESDMVYEDAEEVLEEQEITIAKPKKELSKKTPALTNKKEKPSQAFKEVEENSAIETEEDILDEEVAKVEESVIWKGKIKDNYGMPLSGVNIIAKGTEKQVVTNFDGNYSIEVSPKNTLEINQIGFKTKQIVYDNHKDIRLEQDAAALDNVAVVGYGTRKKREVSGVAEKVKTTNLPRTSSIKIDQALSGKVAGVKISETKVDAEIAAKPPQGSDEGFKNWVVSQLNAGKFEKDKKYIITSEFTIDQNGNVTDVKILSDEKFSIKKHLKQVLVSSALWSSATKNKLPIEELKTLTYVIEFN